MISYAHSTLIFLALLSYVVQTQEVLKNSLNVTKSIHGVNVKTEDKGDRWAVLVAGSQGYGNYRHQAGVCHAYQILRKGGLKDENIIVFMYDDIAFNRRNPRPGIIINNPNGSDVYQGVPKDYIGRNSTVDNFFAVLLGNKSGLTGGSGKVVDGSPNDHIFIFYTDHGSPGSLSMAYGDDLYANDLIDVLKKMHKAKAYKSMVIYLEACDAGSIFEGLLPSNINIYAVTASNSNEDSYATYCFGDKNAPPTEYGNTCLGDLFSVSWMEDSELHDRRNETVGQQYEVVRRRTIAGDSESGRSHVMQYGDLTLRKDMLFAYMGADPANPKYTFSEYNSLRRVVNQREATLLHLQNRIHNAPKGSLENVEARKELLDIVSHIRHVEHSINRIAKILFGNENASMLKMVRPSGQPLVDDWNCLKMFVRIFEKHCGCFSWYGKKYKRTLANMCNAGVNAEQMIEASTQVCHTNN